LKPVSLPHSQRPTMRKIVRGGLKPFHKSTPKNKLMSCKETIDVCLESCLEHIINGLCGQNVSLCVTPSNH
jgi:hypothetical protein